MKLALYKLYNYKIYMICRRLSKLEISDQESESPDFIKKRKHVRLPAQDSRALKIAIRNEGLSAVANLISLRDISVGGVGLTVPDAPNLISTGIDLDFAILLPNEDICWLAGTVVNVGDDRCGIQFHEDFEQKKLSRYILQIERELRGYERWGEDSGHSALSKLILEAVWGGAAAPEGKKLLIISTDDGPPSFLTGKYELKMVREVKDAKPFQPDLIIMDSDSLSFNVYRQYEIMKRDPLIGETPVFIFLDSGHEARHIDIKVRSGDSISCSIPVRRFETEMQNIVNVLLNKYEMKKSKIQSGPRMRDRYV